MKRFFLVIFSIFLGLWVSPWIGIMFSLIIVATSSYNFQESLLVGLLMDIAYQPWLILSGITVPVFSLVSVIGFFVARAIQKRLVFYV